MINTINIEISKPIMKSNDKYLLIAEENGKTLYLINNTNLTFLDLNKKTISLTLKPEIDILLAMGVSIKWERNNLHIQKKGDIKGLNIEVTPTTIQSDHQHFFVLL